MLASNIKTVRNDMRTLMRDAQELLKQAASLSGDKADEMRQRGMAMLDAAAVKAQELQAAAIETSKEVASGTDEFVRENPWKAVAISAGVGVLIGMLIARR